MQSLRQWNKSKTKSSLKHANNSGAFFCHKLLILIVTSFFLTVCFTWEIDSNLPSGDWMRFPNLTDDKFLDFAMKVFSSHFVTFFGTNCFIENDGGLYMSSNWIVHHQNINVQNQRFTVHKRENHLVRLKNGEAIV